MFGFNESPYTVLKKHERPRIEAPAGIAYYELRQCVADQKVYIAVFSKDAGGRSLSDHLFYYETANLAEADFEQLAGATPLRLKDLRYEKYIKDHATGYRRNVQMTRW